MNRWVVWAAVCAGLCGLQTGAAAAEREPRAMSVDGVSTLDATLALGDVLPLRVEVPAGEAVIVEVRSDVVDPAADVKDGNDAYSTDSPATFAGTEFVVFEARGAPRTADVALRLAQGEGGTGAINVQVRRLHGVDGEVARAWAALGRRPDPAQASAIEQATVRSVALEGLLATCTAVSNPRCVAEAQLALGGQYELLGRHDAVQPMYAAAIEGFIALRSGYGEIAARLGYATRLYYGGDTAAAEAIYARCSTLAAEHGLPFVEATCENYVAVMRQYAGDLDAALRHYARAQRVLGDLRVPIAVQMRINIGGVHELQGDVARALAAYRSGVDFAGDDPRFLNARASALSNLGALKATLGETQESIALLSEALAAYRNDGEVEGQSRVLGILAYQYQRLRRFSLAEPLLRAAIGLCEPQANQRCLAVAWRNLAGMLAEQGRGDEAALAFDRAREHTLAANSTYTSALFYVKAIDFHLQRGELDKAAEALDAMRGDAGIAVMASQHSATRLRAGRLLAAQGRADDARIEFQAVLDAAASASADASASQARLELARLDAARQDWAAVERAATANIDRIDNVREEFFDPLVRADFLATRQEAFELLIEAKLARHRAGDAAALHDAFDVDERSRSRALLDALAADDVAAREGSPALLAARDAMRLKQVALTRFEARAAAADAQRLEAMRSDVALARVALEAEELRTRSSTQATTFAAASRSGEVQSLLRGDQEAILVYRVRASRSWMWVVTRDALRIAPLPARDALALRAERFAHDARGEGRDPEADGRWLYDALIGAAGLPTTTQRLLLVPDGPLQQLPFAALRSPDGRYLVESMQLSMLPSTSVAVVLRQRAHAPRSYPTQDVVVFADPVFGIDDRRVASHADGMRGILDGEPLPRLPGTAREARAMVETFGDARVRVFDGFDATLDAARGETARNARILHFATHGIVDAAAPELTGLALARVRPDGTPAPGDGFFNLPLIGQTRYSADLVILSACESALGRDIEGEGLIGLSRGFLAAGAGGVVATLWPVSDRHAATLEARFASALRDGVAVPQALAIAQREAIADPLRRRPRDWAAFGFYGDIR